MASKEARLKYNDQKQSFKTTLKRSDQNGDIVTLGPTDVIFGRGNGFSKSNGNVQFRYIVWQYKDEYARASRSCKGSIAKMVMEDVAKQKPPGRFVEELGDGKHYVVADPKRAFEKTCQALREKKNGFPKQLSSAMKSRSMKFKVTIRVKVDEAISKVSKDKKEGIVPAQVRMPRALPMSETKEEKKNEHVPVQPVRRTLAKSPRRASVSRRKGTAKSRSTWSKSDGVDFGTSVVKAAPDTSPKVKPVSSKKGRLDELINVALVDHKENEIMPAKIDEAFALMPPHLTAFFSGIFPGQVSEEVYGKKADTAEPLSVVRGPRGKDLKRVRLAALAAGMHVEGDESDEKLQPLPPDLTKLISGLGSHGSEEMLRDSENDPKQLDRAAGRPPKLRSLISDMSLEYKGYQPSERLSTTEEFEGIPLGLKKFFRSVFRGNGHGVGTSFPKQDCPPTPVSGSDENSMSVPPLLAAQLSSIFEKAAEVHRNAEVHYASFGLADTSSASTSSVIYRESDISPSSVLFYADVGLNELSFDRNLDSKPPARPGRF